MGVAKSKHERYTVSAVSRDAQAVMDSYRYQRIDKCFSYLNNGTGAAVAEADFTSWDSDGFTWNYTTNTTANNQNAPFIYMAIKGGIWDVGVTTQPTTNTTVVTNTNPHGTLRGICTADNGSNLVTSTSIASTFIMDIGASDGTNTHNISTFDTDNADPSVAVGISSSTYLVWLFIANATAASSTLIGRCTVSFATSSFTTTWTNVDGTERYIPYWALSEFASNETSTKSQVIRFQKSTGVAGTNQIVNLNFTPKAVIVYSSGGTSDGTADAHWQYIQGFSDGTNYACIATSSEDAAAAADSARYHSNSVAFLQQNTATPATTTSIGYCVFASNKVIWTWSINDAVATDITIWAFGGKDITDAKVNTVDINRTTAGDQNYTGLGFNPADDTSVLFLLAANVQTLNSSTTTANVMFGCSTTALTGSRRRKPMVYCPSFRTCGRPFRYLEGVRK